MLAPPVPPAALARRLEDLPDGPGVYLFLDARRSVLYVGKAKSLRKRVASYFQAVEGRPARLEALVAEAADLDWLVTANEVEALILENSLIKKNRPRYNVNLRDDKNYPYLRLTTSEDFPQVDVVRRARRDGDAYFGPYIPASTARKTQRLLARYFGLRSCKGPIDQKDHRACLYYHLDQCLAPCTGHSSKDEYAAAVQDATLFLEGRRGPLRERLQARMQGAAAAEDFERAAHYRDLDRMVEAGGQAQRMASTALEQQDVWGFHRRGDDALLLVAFVRDGTVRGRREFLLPGTGEVAEAPLLGDALRQYYHAASFVPDEVVVPFEPDELELTAAFLDTQGGRRILLKVPQRGPRAARAAWVAENTRLAFDQRLARGAGTRRALECLGEALGLPGPPDRIDCFDISHVQGSDIVASMSVLIEGQPAPREYRRFIIRSLPDGQDDFKAMHEVVSRRYRRVLEDSLDLPDLVIVDGGLGQLGAAQAALDALELSDLSLCALAKREETLFVRGRLEPVRLPLDSPALNLARRVRDEAHRFAVAYHRRRRSARTLTSALDAVPGVGPAKRRALLRAFGSVSGVSRATTEQLAAVVGERLARTVKLHLVPD